jgi:hypothetical protein
MNHSSHLKHMLIGGAVLLVGMVAFGVPLAAALLYAMLLACPLMMTWMVFSMSGSQRQGGGDHDHLSVPPRRDSRGDATADPERASVLRPR